MSVEEKIKQIIKDQLGVSEDEVKPEASFVEDLGADSLDLTELIMAMEEEFGVEIADEDAQKILKVKDAIIIVAVHVRPDYGPVCGQRRYGRRRATAAQQNRRPVEPCPARSGRPASAGIDSDPCPDARRGGTPHDFCGRERAFLSGGVQHEP